MASEPKPLKDFITWDAEDLKAFLAIPKIRETFDIEFKGSMDFQNDNLSDKFKLTLGKEISAYANTQGGHLFLGVDEDKLNGSFWPKPGIPAGKHQLSRITDILNSITNPPYLDLKFHEIALEPGYKVIIVFVPDFLVTPIQNQDHKFYRRADGKSVSIPEDLVRALYYKSHVPDVRLELSAKIECEMSNPKRIVFQIEAKITNKSHIRGHDIKVIFELKDFVAFSKDGGQEKLENCKNIKSVLSTPMNFQSPLFFDDLRCHFLHHPTMGNSIMFIAEYGQRSDKDTYPLLEPEKVLVKYTIYADDAPPKIKEIKRKDILPLEISWEK